MSFAVGVFDERGGRDYLIGHIVNYKRDIEYLPDVDVAALQGKAILVPFGSDDVYGPFDSLEQLQEWAKART